MSVEMNNRTLEGSIKKASLENDWKEIKLSKGQTVFSEGDPAMDLFFVIEGLIEVERDALTSSRKLITDLVEPGDIFGWDALLRERHSTAKATKSSKVLSIPTKQLRQMMQEDPMFGRDLLTMVAMAVTRADDRGATMKYSDTEQRVASALLDYQAVGALSDLTHRRLGSRAGVSRQYTTSTISSLEEGGVIERTHRVTGRMPQGVTILSTKKLQNLAHPQAK